MSRLSVMSFNVCPKSQQVSLLSDSECSKILHRSKKPGRLVYFDLEYKAENNMGFLGDYLGLVVVTASDSEEHSYHSYFVKSLPTLKGEEEAMETIFKKEADIYRGILNKIGDYSKIKWKPNCYLSRANLIVMEDLMSSGHAHVPDFIDLNLDHLKSVLESLAAMHASSIVYEAKTSVNLAKEYKELLFETTVRRDVEWFSTGIRCLLNIAKIHPKYQSAHFQNFIAERFEAMLEPVYEMAGESPKYRNVICHRDTWRNNMLFMFDDDNFLKPISCTLVDFQFCCYCPPAIDVLFCLYLNLRKANRQHAEKECLKWYHDCLRMELAHHEIDVDDHLTWEAFLKSCDHVKLFPVLYNGLASTVIHVPKEILLDIRSNDPDMYRKFRTVDRSDVIMEVLERHAGFRERMLETVEELMEELLTRRSLELLRA